MPHPAKEVLTPRIVYDQFEGCTLLCRTRGLSRRVHDAHPFSTFAVKAALLTRSRHFWNHPSAMLNAFLAHLGSSRVGPASHSVRDQTQCAGLSPDILTGCHREDAPRTLLWELLLPSQDAHKERQDMTCLVSLCVGVDDVSYDALVITLVLVMKPPTNGDLSPTPKCPQASHGLGPIPTPQHRGLASTSRVGWFHKIFFCIKSCKIKSLFR